MAKISFIEQQYFEKIFQMNSGYVLDFSNAKFQRFVYQSLGIDIYQKYIDLSKAKILRSIIQDFDDKSVGKLLLELMEYKRIHQRVEEHEKEQFLACVAIAHRMIGKTVPQANVSKPILNAFNFDKYHKELMRLATSTNAQQRGYELERYLRNLFEESNLQPRKSFKIEGEQIDGSFCYANEIYLLEAKWQATPATKDDLVIFNEKVASKSSFTRGFFFSWSGFMPNSITTFNLGRVPHIILMDGQELTMILERRILFNEALAMKIRCLAEEGKCYKPADELI